MPPKKKGKLSGSKADPAPHTAAPAALWYFKLHQKRPDDDPTAWQRYTDAEIDTIESAFKRKQKTVTVGDYVLHFKNLVQRRKGDSSRERPVLRQSLSDPSDSELHKSPDPVKRLTTLLVERRSSIGAGDDDDDDAIEVEPPAKKAKRDDSLADSSTSTLLADSESGGVGPTGTILQTGGGSPFARAMKAAPDQLAVFGEKHLTPSASKVLFEMLGSVPGMGSVPPIERIPLDAAGIRMRGMTRVFLHALGRDKEESGASSCCITLSRPLSSLPKDLPLSIGKAFTTSTGELQDLAAKARVTVLKGKVKGGAKGAVLESSKPMTKDQVREAQLIAVSGPVLAVFDNSYRSKANTHKPFQMVSIPGINLAYSEADREYFTTTEGGKPVLSKERVRLRMKEVWAHALQLMHLAGVKWPVLCAIGCGAFKGPFKEVPYMWGEALSAQLTQHNYGFDAVLISLPKFGKEQNFMDFKKAFEDGASVRCPVVLVECLSMVPMADYLASHGLKAGVLNPSDVEAVRKGKMGMFWDGGNTALEEILAMQTSLLVQHIGVNPELWRDPSRHKEVDAFVAK